MFLKDLNMRIDNQALNAEQHSDLKKTNTNDFPHIKAEQLVQVNMFEFPAASTCFPLFFIKDRSSAKLFPIALLGLAKGQNLFYSKDGWMASYVPLHMQSWPFSVTSIKSAEGAQQWQVLADVESSYLNTKEGQALFVKGQPSAFLTQITDMLISDTQQKFATAQFIDFLVQQSLVKAIKLELDFSDGEKQMLDGVYAIDEDALNNLQPQQVQEMYQKDYFKAVYSMLSSQHNLYELIKRSRVSGGGIVTGLGIVNL